MVREPRIYQKNGQGWYVESTDNLEGPLDSCQDAQQYLQLMQRVKAARTEIVCLDRECL